MPNNIVTPMDTRVAELQKVIDQHGRLIDQLTVAVRVLTEEVAALSVAQFGAAVLNKGDGTGHP